MLLDHAGRNDRLAELGTSWPALERAIRSGEAGWRVPTKRHGSGAPARYAYHERLAALRLEQKKRFEWESARQHQIELVVNPERTIAIQTMLGDSRTGVPGNPPPRSRYPRGKKGRLLLAQENPEEQLGLFGIEAPEEIDLSEAERLDVWVLLVNRIERPDGAGGVIWRSELSKPCPTDERGYITDWFERTPLPVLTIDAVVFPDDDEGPGELDIPINFR